MTLSLKKNSMYIKLPRTLLFILQLISILFSFTFLLIFRFFLFSSSDFLLGSFSFSLKIFYSVVLLVPSSLRFVLLGNIFILPLFPKNIFARYKILGWQGYFCWILEKLLHGLLALTVSIEKPAVSLNIVLLKIIFFTRFT